MKSEISRRLRRLFGREKRAAPQKAGVKPGDTFRVRDPDEARARIAMLCLEAEGTVVASVEWDWRGGIITVESVD